MAPRAVPDEAAATWRVALQTSPAASAAIEGALDAFCDAVSVFEVEGRKELLINCIEEVPNHRDAMLFFKLLGHGPLLLRDGSQRVLLNALGGGITLGLKSTISCSLTKLLFSARFSGRPSVRRPKTCQTSRLRRDWNLTM